MLLACELGRLNRIFGMRHQRKLIFEPQITIAVEATLRYWNESWNRYFCCDRVLLGV